MPIDMTEVLPSLIEVISFEELKRLRLVSRPFNEIIRESSRYIKAQVKFGRRWKREWKQLAFQFVTKWQNVYFDSFPLTRNIFRRTYWNDGKLRVRTLTMYKIPCECRALGRFIKECPLLENVTIKDVRFDEKKEHVGNNGRQRIKRTICGHSAWYPNANINQEAVVPTLKYIAFEKQNLLPICLLDVFQHKSRGTLVEFKISDQDCTLEDRPLCVPSQEAVHIKIRAILNASVATLKKISVVDCRGNDGGLFVSSLPNSVHNMQLEHVTFSILKPNFGETLLFLNCIQHITANIELLEHRDGENQFNFIQELQLIFKGSFSDGEQLLDIIEKLKNHLKVLRIEFNGDILRRDFNLGNMLENSNRLHTLAVKKSKKIDNNSKTLNPEFLTHLPKQSLKSLTVDLLPAPTPELFASLIDPTKCAKITQLIIGNGGKQFSNGHMHTIIKSMPLLQDLQVISASLLSDNGICSISPNLADNIITNKSYFLLTSPELLYQDQPRESIIVLSQLKHLRKVSFRGCNISDVAIRIAFHFPEIRCVDLSCNLNVTDIGLIWLCKQNPSIENLIIKDNIKVSQFGVNQLVNNFPTLAKIYTTNVVNDRRFSELKGYECPRYNRAVQVTRI